MNTSIKIPFICLKHNPFTKKYSKNIKSGDVEAAMRTAKLFWKDAEDTDYDK